MHMRVVRLAFVCALVTGGGALAGCSSSGSAGTSGSPAGAPSSSAGAPAQRGTAGSGRPTSAPRPSSGGDPRAAMPVITPKSVGTVAYAPASAQDKARFTPVRKASGGLITKGSVTSVTVSGRDVGAVAVYGTKQGLAKSPMFQDQYVVQLMNAVAGADASPRFVRSQGKVVALSTGAQAVAGWFDGDRVVLVFRAAKSPDLAALAHGVRSTPVTG